MDDLLKIKSESVARFWDKYIEILIKQGVKESSRRWYVKHVEQYIQYFPNERLQSHTPGHVAGFFSQIGRDGELSDWQFRQIVSAIRILFCNFLNSELSSTVDWQYWSDASTNTRMYHGLRKWLNRRSQRRSLTWSGIK